MCTAVSRSLETMLLSRTPSTTETSPAEVQCRFLFGLFEDSLASRIRAGIVGSPESIEGVANWIGRCRGEIEAKASNYPYLFPKFPGCNQDTNLKFTVEVGTTS